MRVQTPHFAFDLPDGFAAQTGDGTWSAIHDADVREITVSSLMAKEEAPVDDVMRRVAELRVEVLRKNGGADHAEPIVFEDRGDLRVAWFATVGKTPLLSYCALVTHRRPVMGQRCVVSFCLYQYFRPGMRPPDAGALLSLGSSILSTLEPLPQRAVLERASAQAVAATDGARLYPYLVPEGYLESRPPTASKPRALGHGLYLALAEDFDGAARVHFPAELPSLGTPEAIVKIAGSNLVRAVREQRVTIQGFQGPRGLPAIIFGPQWLAASCLLLPDLHAFAGRHLGQGPLCAAVPHRNTMLVFREEDATYRAEMKALIAKNEAGAPKPLTSELFVVRADGIEPMA
jgi:hypothetical protein